MLDPFQCEVVSGEVEDRDAREALAVAQALALPRDIDYVRIVHHGSRTDRYVVAARGEPCPTGGDRAACEAELTQLEAVGYEKPQVFAIVHRGDAFALYEGDEILSLTRPIDTPERAWLVLMVRELVGAYACDDAYWTGQRPAGDGFELASLSTTSTCRPFQRVRTVYRISADGMVTRVAAVIAEHHAERCMR